MKSSLTIIVAITVACIFALPAHAVDEQIIYAFQGGSDGAVPGGQLIFDSAGNAYGVTEGGGSCPREQDGCGTVFELTPSSSGWTHTVIYNFAGGEDGEDPVDGLAIDSQGNLYGATEVGGGSKPNCRGGCGTVFELSPGPSGWTETVIHKFHNAYGAYPRSTVTLGPNGELYGTTYYTTPENAGGGTVYELSPQPGGTWTFTTLHIFEKLHDGSSPIAPVSLDGDGNVYGTTPDGGLYSDDGVVFKLVHNPKGFWDETIIHSFIGGLDGQQPLSGVTIVKGDVYGLTQEGGAYGQGVLYELTPAPGEWNAKIIHAFSDQDDGAQPFYSPLTLDSDGNMYGTTYYGGDHQYGVLFEFNPTANGGWHEDEIYSFNGEDYNEYPSYGVAVNGGHFLGVNQLGGNNYGVIFEATRAGKSKIPISQ
jgi:uncharacterized repeat protein (TIGR03803 family)